WLPECGLPSSRPRPGDVEPFNSLNPKNQASREEFGASFFGAWQLANASAFCFIIAGPGTGRHSAVTQKLMKTNPNFTQFFTVKVDPGEISLPGGNRTISPSWRAACHWGAMFMALIAFLLVPSTAHAQGTLTNGARHVGEISPAGDVDS